MYENNYNYVEVPGEGKDKKKDNKAGRTVAMLLAVAIVGGASGFGGAYLQNSIASDNQPAASASSDNAQQTSGNSETPAVTSSSSSSDTSGNVVNTLLNTSPSDGTLTTKQIVEKVSPSVVGVHSSFTTSSGTSTGTGTGIILSDDGYIITNAHVVQTEVSEYVSNSDNNRYGSNPFSGGGDIFDYFFGGSGIGGSYQKKLKQADTVKIVLSTDEDTEYEAEIVGADENSDLAVLKINAEGLDLIPAEFGDSNQLTMGDKAVAIGYPLGLGLSTSEGIVSGLNRTLNVELSSGGSASMTLIQTDAAINPGNSGGPLINGNGQVIGITSSKLVDSSVEGLGFAIPISDAMPLISDLMNKGYVTNTTPQIGITGSDINSAIMRYYNLPVDKGVMVVSVSEGSGAEAAGISAGDVIVAADGKDITSMDELTAAKKGKAIGDTMVLTLARADGNVDVTLTLTGEDDRKPEAEVSSN